MAKEKKYTELQDEAEILGIKQNQNAEALTKAIAEATTPAVVSGLMETNRVLVEAAESRPDESEVVGKLKEELEGAEELLETITGEAKLLREKVKTLESRPDAPTAPDVDAVVKGISELHEAQLANRDVYTDPYLTGIANGLFMALGKVTGKDMSEELLQPVTQQVDIKGAKILSGRQRLIKEASKFIYMKGSVGSLRSGLTPVDVEKADEIMKVLKVEKGKYNIPAE